MRALRAIATLKDELGATDITVRAVIAALHIARSRWEPADIAQFGPDVIEALSHSDLPRLELPAGTTLQPWDD